MSKEIKSGTNIIEGFKDFKSYVDQLDSDILNELTGNLSKTKDKLFNIAENKKQSNNNPEFIKEEAQDDTNEDTGVAEKTQNLLNRFNQTGLKADLSGVGFEKTFGNKDQGLSATVYGQQDFGRPAQYGARLGFNYKF